MSGTYKKNSNDASVRFLYGTSLGRILLHVVLKLHVPALLGCILRSPVSRFYIPSFIKKNGIDMSDFKDVKFKSFNDFFTRKKEISFDSEPNHLISPADSLLSVYKITEDSKFHIKGFDYTLTDFFEPSRFNIENNNIEKSFIGGLCLVFRLCATDYHRYCYVDSGTQNGNHFIQGSLYSVQPLAAENFRLYTKNRRSWTILNTENFGTIAQIEIGAFSVGGIQNHYDEASFKKGEEKGYFDLHGSTIVLLLQKDSVKLLDEIKKVTDSGEEYRVKIGDCVATKK
ncbi:MAG: phosphatidylserine decarboxylase [Treponema sp.]|uniref:phosphatidylserine decarboxylase n=1 Tax=Treponema sp. TaxID=166 RepID=UPI0025EC033D|nr:phosphatidylserine decarboxylase [Treponema sp.]MBQ9281903.1 phosphatidylserine decarboxylase [Treponema sp.]